MTHSRDWIAAIIPLLLGFALVVTGLTRVSLWSDEGWTIAASADPNPAVIVADWVIPDVHPPLYFIALGGWRTFTGDTVFELRYFSVLVTLLGIALAYRLGASLFNPVAGWIAATFYALHDLVGVLTQEVRHYPGQMALVTLALWLYWRFHQQPTRGRGIALALAGSAAVYTHYWAAFVLLACALHALISHRRDRPALIRAAWPFVGMAALFALWIPAVVHQITLERPGGLPHALENTNFVYRVLLFQLLGTPEVFWLVLMAVGVFGTWLFTAQTARRRPESPALLLLLAVIVPPALTIALNVAYPILSFRALAVIVPPAMALAAYGLSRFRPPERAVVLVFIVAFSLTNTSAAPIERPDWPTIADDISARSTAADLVLLENDTDEHTLAYYLDMAGRGTAYAHTENVRLFAPDDYADFLAAALAGIDGVWVSKLGWPGLSWDIRPELAAHGFVESAPERDYGRYNDRPILLWRLDRAPTDAAPLVTYGDDLRLLRADVAHHPDALTVNLLWSPSVAPDAEYTVSILLFSADGIRNQDSRPLNGESPTSTWSADGLYFDSHLIPLDGLSGTVQIGVQVYSFTDETFTATQNALTDDCTDDAECRFVIIGAVGD